MKKFIWVTAVLAFLGTLALANRERLVNGRTQLGGRAASASSPNAMAGEGIQGRHDRDAARDDVKGSRTLEPAPFRPSSQLDATQNVGGGSASEVDPRWGAAARLPHSVWERLKDSDEPTDRELFERNSQLSRPGTADAWGNAMQEQIEKFFAAPSFTSRPEAVGAQITVACREDQCQVQVINAPVGRTGEEVPSAVIIDDLRRQPWYQAELELTVGQVTGNNGKPYLLQYFDRK